MTKHGSTKQKLFLEGTEAMRARARYLPHMLRACEKIGRRISKPFIPRTGLALSGWCVGPVNPLLTKEGARGRLSDATFQTSPDPSLVRRGTLVERFIGSSARLLRARIEGCQPGDLPREMPLDTRPERRAATRGERVRLGISSQPLSYYWQESSRSAKISRQQIRSSRVAPSAGAYRGTGWCSGAPLDTEPRRGAPTRGERTGCLLLGCGRQPALRDPTGGAPAWNGHEHLSRPTPPGAMPRADEWPPRWGCCPSGFQSVWSQPRRGGKP